jgi:hypothetical protein
MEIVGDCSCTKLLQLLLHTLLWQPLMFLIWFTCSILMHFSYCLVTCLQTNSGTPADVEINRQRALADTDPKPGEGVPLGSKKGGALDWRQKLGSIVGGVPSSAIPPPPPLAVPPSDWGSLGLRSAVGTVQLSELATQHALPQRRLLCLTNAGLHLVSTSTTTTTSSNVLCLHCCSCYSCCRSFRCCAATVVAPEETSIAAVRC